MELERVEQLSEAQIADLCRLYAETWWTIGRQESDVRQMLASSSGFVGMIDPASRRLVAFARFVTDGVYKALVFDVIVDEQARGLGLGRRLMDALLEHSGLQGVRHVELYCLPEMAPFYRRWGFTDDVAGVRLMRRSVGP